MNNRLYCFYDLAVSPCSFDFFQFVALAEIQRKRENFNDIEIIFVYGPNNGYRQDDLRTFEQNDQQFKNVILPGCQLLPSIKNIRILDDRNAINVENMNPHSIFPKGYKLKKPVQNYMYNGIVCAHFLGEEPIKFEPPAYATNSINSYISTFKKNSNILVLSTRELKREDNSKFRTMNYNIWENYFENLDLDEWQPIIIRDTHRSLDRSTLFDGVPEADFASNHLHLRFALYEAANINIFKSNGPAVLSLLGGEKPMLMFLKPDNNVSAMSESWFSNNLGMSHGSQFPFSSRNKIVIWGEEKVDIIKRTIESVNDKSKIINKSKFHDYINIKNLVNVVQVSLNYTLRNLVHGIWMEDIKFFNLYDQLIEKKILNAKVSYQILSELDGNQLPIGTKKTYLSAYENYLGSLTLNQKNYQNKVS